MITSHSRSILRQSSTWAGFEFMFACGITCRPIVKIWVTMMRTHMYRVEYFDIHRVGVFTFQGKCR